MNENLEKLKQLVEQKKNKNNRNNTLKPEKSIGTPRKGIKMSKKGGFFDK